MVWEDPEKRKFPRANIPCRIIIYFPDEHILNAHTENIGCGGLRVILEEDLVGVSSIVGMEIFLSNDKTVRCKGRIVWKLEEKNSTGRGNLLYDFGIEFVDIKDSDKQEVSKLVESLL